MKHIVHRIDIAGYTQNDGTYRWRAVCCDCRWKLTFDADHFSLAYEHGYVHSYRMNRMLESVGMDELRTS